MVVQNNNNVNETNPFIYMITNEENETLLRNEEEKTQP